MAVRPTLRKVPARILATPGWLRASLALGPGETLVQHLERPNESGRFLNILDAELPGSADRVAFLALQRSAVTLIVPDAGEPTERPAGAEDRVLRCVLEHGSLHGTIALPAGRRVSDLLAHHDGFFPVREVRLHRSVGADPIHLPLVFVNACRLVGVVDATA
jgi:hypothetical protein